MKPIELTINQEPVAKGRPKFAIRNGVSRTYTPQKTQDAQESLYAVLSDKIHPLPIHIPLKLTVVLHRTKSKWLPKKERLPFRKPDADNFLKLVCDSLCMRKVRHNDQVFMLTPIVQDDAQFTTINVSKRWSKNGHGYITIRIEDDIEEG
jgi:Holliday junction resolvase RusA-like endonuclease